MQSVYLRQVADPQAASFVPGLAPDLEPGSPITIHNCPSLSVLEINFQSQLPLYLRSGIGEIQDQLCGLLFFLRTLPHLTIGFVLSPLCKVHPSTLVPAGGMQTYVTLQPLLHSSQPYAIHLHSLLFFVQRSPKIHNSCKM